MQKMELREDAACSCGEAKQMAEHIINFCPDTKCYGDFLALDKAATNWLHKLNIDVASLVRIVNIMKVYIERTNLQVELI